MGRYTYSKEEREDEERRKTIRLANISIAISVVAMLVSTIPIWSKLLVLLLR